MDEKFNETTPLAASSRLDRRLARPGSVLIMAVAVLVLLAGIGAAYLSVTRDERYSSQQHVANTQVDLLANGLSAMTQGIIANEIFDNAQTNPYRPFTSTTYQPWDCSLPASGSTNTAGIWIADRIPTVNAGGTVVWNSISWPLVSNATGGGFQFDLPNSATPHTLTLPKGQFAPASSIVINGARYPRLQEYDGTTPVGTPFLAADADGDGIADSGLVKFAEVNGVTYYYALRIVDNNSAINANTAWAQQVDFAANENTGTLQNKGFFPANIGLREMLASYNSANYSCPEMNALNLLRFGYGSSPGPAFASLTPVNDSGVVRTDFKFISQGDAFWMQSGRRLDNPGFNSTTTAYSPLPWSETAPLAYHMCLRDPTMLPGMIETALAQSTYTNAPSAPYPVDNFNTWYSSNFNYGSSSYNIRPLLVTHNGVSNTLRPLYGPTTSLPTVPTAQPLDPSMPAWNTPVQARCSVNTAAFGELFRAYWCVMAGAPPYTDQCPWSLFNSSYQYPNSLFDSLDPYLAATPPYVHPAHMFRSSIRHTDQWNWQGWNWGWGWGWWGSGQSSHIVTSQMMRLRASIAAVNTLDMRQHNGSITTMIVPVSVSGDSHWGWFNGRHWGYDNNSFNSYVRVCAVRPQPYITEIYANTDTVASVGGKTNPVGYYAIEFYNPFPYAISMKNWTIVNKYQDPNNGWQTPTLYSFGSSSYPTVPANGYLVLENYQSHANGNDAQYRPASAHAAAASATCSYFYVNGLDQVANQEIIFMRPRDTVNNNLVQGNDGVAYDENNPYDCVPVDQFDFTGLPQADDDDDDGDGDHGDDGGNGGGDGGGNGGGNGWGGNQTAYILHYCRANGPGNAWKFVYPGRYNGGLSQQRQDGTQQAPFNAGSTEPTLTPLANIGGPDAIASYDVPANGGIGNSHVYACQIANVGWAGNNPVQTSGNAYPFGEFARNGDMLAVPFIGSYVIQVRDNYWNLGEVLEANSITMDAACADSADPSDASEEQLGRFCPLTSSDLTDDRIGTTTAATTTMLTDPHRLEGANYFTNYLYTVKILSGPAINQCRVVTASAVASVTVSPGFSVNPGVGAQYLITKTAQGNVTSATSTTLVDPNRTEAANYWVGWDLNITSGPGNGESAIVTAYSSTSHTFTILNVAPLTGWPTTPTSASTYTLTRQRYNWAEKFFDYLSVLNPNDDYLPNVDPNNYFNTTNPAWTNNTRYTVGQSVQYNGVNYRCTATPTYPVGNPPPASYWTNYWIVIPGPAAPVANVTPGIANGGKEDIVPIEGLVNVNTAPWPVLAMLPMVADKNTGLIDTAQNVALAKAIVAYRQMAGPFQSIYDLNKVIDFNNPTCGFQNGYGTIIFDNNLADEPGSNQGYFSGAGAGGTSGGNDFEEKFLMLNRISNMITTRSDSYTVYILVEGWRGVPNGPSLVVQRRLCYLCDRTQLTPTNKVLSTINVPTN